MPNRLARETSPYLLQHSDNPVDWYPWGEEALERSRAEDKPILLSVGYSACHWCHVMEHESFSDPETAALMNDLYVNIKVDREERPDVDALYMQAVQQMTGRGGWPMTVFLTPDGSPFYGGTYFPPEPRPGLPSFRQILTAVHDAYSSRRGEVDSSAAELRNALAQGMSVNPAAGSISETVLQRAFHTVASRFDDSFGGFGGAPKFPQPMLLDFLLRFWARTGADEALGMARETLEKMWQGGIYDQLGGGFHRYSVDARWLVPHFEKMLYDNALLSRVYTRAYQADQNPEFRRIAEETLDYVLREMRHPSGGFFSSQDADSEGEEGIFYVWSAEEIDDMLGKDAPLFRAYFGVSDAGNWEGSNILHVARPLEEVVRELGMEAADASTRLEAARRKLYEVRSERVWPGRDEKILTSWNAMMLHAFAEAGRVFDNEGYVSAATASGDFILDQLRLDGALMRTWRDGNARIHGFLEDYALVVDGLVELYRATADLRWVREARPLADRMIDAFWSPAEEMFYDAAAGEGGLIIRPRDIYDNATPSGTSAAAQALTRLARLTGEPRYDQIASRVVQGLADVASRVPQGFGHLLGAVSHQLAPPTEVAIVGDLGAEDTRALLDVLRRRFLPETTLAFRGPGLPEEEVAVEIPLLADRAAVNGKATAFVCQHYACRLPVTTVHAFEEELSSVFQPART